MTKKEIALLLLKKNCLKLSPRRPFTYASGLKGPMYCDNRKILAFVKERSQVIDSLVEKINETGLEFDHICGLATAGIPHGALVAERLKKPFIYVRAKAKSHGRQNQVEGFYQKGERTLLIEDLVNQGKSLEEAVIGVRSVELHPIACFAIVDYQMKKSKERLEKLDLPLFALTDFENIINTALELKLISENEKNDLIIWQNCPEDWASKIS